MRQLLLCRRASPGQVLVVLGMEEALWQACYERVMRLPPERPLARFWRHYYGSSAEPSLTPELLPLLLEDIDAVLRHPVESAALREFLVTMRRMAVCALRRAADLSLTVVAD